MGEGVFKCSIFTKVLARVPQLITQVSSLSPPSRVSFFGFPLGNLDGCLADSDFGTHDRLHFSDIHAHN